MGCKQLFFESANWQALATQRDLASHGDVATDWDLAERTGNRRGDRNSSRRAIFRYRAFRNMHMNVEIAVELPRQSETVRPRAYVGHSRVGRFLHNIA